MRLIVAVVLCSTALPLAADDGLNTKFGYMEGRFRMVGVGSNGFVDQMVRLDEADGGMAVEMCDNPDAGMLVPGDGELGDSLEGRIGSEEVWCEVFNSWGNHPILTCSGDGSSNGGTRLTLWPGGGSTFPLECDE
ncbi:hypothetical protein [Tabrizicola sp.]|uniref:hypothetical protein n=1 Tax=Tabrizicola sp. TaxID=2005166 RepID=UPI003F2ABCA6